MREYPTHPGHAHHTHIYVGGILRFLRVYEGMKKTPRTRSAGMSNSSEKYLTPALSTSGQASGAYEIKFLLPHDEADSVLAYARRNLKADPHSDPSLGDGYYVNSLYLDSPNFDTFYRRDGYRREKYRVRRYGLGTSIMLECKAKSRGLVKKRRIVVPNADVAYLIEGKSPTNWVGEWYHEKLNQRQLSPVCNVSYRRVARVGMTTEGPIRLTVDRDLRCQRADGFAVPRALDGTTLLTGKSIVEMKFFKTIVHELALTPQQASKFRLSVEECYGLSPTPRTSAHQADAEWVSRCG